MIYLIMSCRTVRSSDGTVTRTSLPSFWVRGHSDADAENTARMLLLPGGEQRGVRVDVTAYRTPAGVA